MRDVYDEKYFSWQRKIGEFGGKANLFKFQAHVKPTDVVLDFGCGGGYLTKNMDCAKRLGIEVNPAAAQIAKSNGIECYASIDLVPDSSVNVVVSNHALEHVHDPCHALKQLRAKLVRDGLLVVVVPCEGEAVPFKRDDINQHLYTWNPQLLGNLAVHAGYNIVDVHPIYHKWPKNFVQLQEWLGWRGFHFLAHVNGWLQARNCQVKLVATTG